MLEASSISISVKYRRLSILPISPLQLDWYINCQVLILFAVIIDSHLHDLPTESRWGKQTKQLILATYHICPDWESHKLFAKNTDTGSGDKVIYKFLTLIMK